MTDCDMTKASAGDVPQISLVIVGWQMQRELPRTILSLSRAFQRNVEDLDYEILVVDNGSDPCPELPRIDPPVRFMVARTVSPSPVGAMNEALSQARGKIVGAWIDGARMASPNLLSAVRAASAHHPAPVVAVPNRQLGPGRQASTVEDGYDRYVEDALLEKAGWPDPSADLFAVSWPEEASVEGPMLESNALFLTRATWDVLGGYDPAFSDLGGGMCNPDMLSRAVALPDTQLIRMDGVATFHQIHGGVSTSDEGLTVARVKETSRTYAALRGHPPRKVRERGWIYDAVTGVLDKG